jgi:hypothetical protein
LPGVQPVSSKLKTPRAAAVAGIVFSVLLLCALNLLILSRPLGEGDPGEWLEQDSWKVVVGINLIPFSAIAFLWPIGVLRDKLGPTEDKLLATVFLAGGLLLIGLLFVAASVIGAMQVAHTVAPSNFRESALFVPARSLAYHLATVYGLKMAGVFLMTVSSIVLGTGITSRWTALMGYAAAAVILVGSQ